MGNVIGIDMGGTKILGILMNEKGKILKNYRKPTGAHSSKKKIISNLIEVINHLKTKNIKKVGIGIPGIVDSKGKIYLPNIKKLRGINLKKILEKRTDMEVFIGNDADCFALAEQRMGSAKAYSYVLGVIIGTGVGTGVIIDNKVYLGSTRRGSEAGHTKLIVNHEVKEVEEIISGPSIIKRYQELSGKKAYTPRVILDKKDEISKKVYQEVVLYTGLFLSNLICTFDPECIVLGGGISNLPFYSDIRKVIKKHLNPSLSGSCKIKKYEMSDDSGTIGAGMLCFS